MTDVNAGYWRAMGGGGGHKESNNKINNKKYNKIHKQNSSDTAPKRKTGRSKTKTKTFLVVVYGCFGVVLVVAFFGGWVFLMGGGGENL